MILTLSMKTLAHFNAKIELTKTAAEQAGLILDINKTKTMVFGDRNIDNNIQIAGNTIENVEKFEYLGSLLTWDNNCSKKIKRRLGKATGAMASLRHIWNSKKLKLENKLRILIICVFSVLIIICIRDMNPKRSRQEKTIGIRNETLPTGSRN